MPAEEPAVASGTAAEVAGEPASASVPTRPAPALPAWPPSSLLTRTRKGEPFLVGELRIRTTIGKEQVNDGRPIYVEAAGGELEGVMTDQRGFIRKVVGTVSADGSFTLQAAGLAGALVRGKKLGDEIAGDLLMSVWGESTGYAPEWHRPAFTFAHAPVARTMRGRWNGMIGKNPVRVSFVSSADGSTGQASYPRGEVSSLEVRTDASTDAVIVEERRGGELRGRMHFAVFDGGAPVLGTWTSADGTESAFVGLGALGTNAGVTRPVALGPSLRLEPRFVLYFGRSCVFDHTWPVLVGAGANVGELNQQLAAWSRESLEAPTCNEESVGPMSERPFQQEVSYTAYPLGGGAFGLELSHWADGNGAHGYGSSRCFVGDPARGRLVEPRLLVNEGKRDALTRLVTKKLLAESSVKSMAGLRKANGGGEEGPDLATVGPETDICFTDKSVDVAFEVYEIGPYSMNAPRVSLTRTEAKPFFVEDALVTAVLR
jgi:hypothetical protein